MHEGPEDPAPIPHQELEWKTWERTAAQISTSCVPAVQEKPGEELAGDSAEEGAGGVDMGGWGLPFS